MYNWRVIKIDNLIRVFLENGKGKLEFSQHHICVDADIGKEGMTEDKIEGDWKTPIGEFKLGIILSIHPIQKRKKDLTYMQITENMY